MATNAGQGTTGGSYDPIVEALLRELIEEPAQAKTGKKTMTSVLTGELLASLQGTGKTTEQAASLKTIVLAQALAPALAEALAPLLAEALTPALVKALEDLASTQETTSKEGAQNK